MPPQGLRNRPAWPAVVALLVLAFAFRLMYGLSSPFWFEDERQVYLIGLRSFARGEWPFFGADVVWTGGQLPGALQAMLIRWPLSVWSAPEAPFVFLNVLSFAALSFFAWYLSRRLPSVPRWLIWAFLLTCPWTMNFSTHIVNTSYVLPGAVIFFVGFFEGMPALRRRLLPLSVAWALMGAGLFFVLQIHMSWVLLPPYILAAAIGLLVGGTGSLGMTRSQAVTRAAIGFAAGSVITGSLLTPTILAYGLNAGHMFGALQIQSQSPLGIITTAARVLSFASFEINRFLGMSTAERALMFWRQPWAVPLALVVAVAGLWQPIWMAITAFRRARDAADWTPVRILTAATIGLVYVFYFFSVRGPQAHAFYVVFPVGALFAFSCWSVWAERPGAQVRRWERIAGVVIVAGVGLHAVLAIDRVPRQSLYVDRPLVAAAIDDANDRYLGDRRDSLEARQDRRPRPVDHVADEAAFLGARAIDDLQLVNSSWTPVAGRFSSFTLTVTNRSRVAAWVDLRYATAYLGAGGQLLAARDGVIKQILQPGETRTWRDMADDSVPPGATAATITIVDAERVIPRSR